jgi:hypothetical protein
MSREWFQITRRPLSRTQYDAFADPLEREEWEGLGWVMPLLSRMAETRSPVSHSKPEDMRRVAAERSRRPANA